MSVAVILRCDDPANSRQLRWRQYPGRRLVWATATTMIVPNDILVQRVDGKRPRAWASAFCLQFRPGDGTFGIAESTIQFGDEIRVVNRECWSLSRQRLQEKRNKCPAIFLG